MIAQILRSSPEWRSVRPLSGLFHPLTQLPAVFDSMKRSYSIRRARPRRGVRNTSGWTDASQIPSRITTLRDVQHTASPRGESRRDTLGPPRAVLPRLTGTALFHLSVTVPVPIEPRNTRGTRDAAVARDRPRTKGHAASSAFSSVLLRLPSARQEKKKKGNGAPQREHALAIRARSLLSRTARRAASSSPPRVNARMVGKVSRQERDSSTDKSAFSVAASRTRRALAGSAKGMIGLRVGAPAAPSHNPPSPPWGGQGKAERRRRSPRRRGRHRAAPTPTPTLTPTPATAIDSHRPSTTLRTTTPATTTATRPPPRLVVRSPPVSTFSAPPGRERFNEGTSGTLEWASEMIPAKVQAGCVFLKGLCGLQQT